MAKKPITPADIAATRERRDAYICEQFDKWPKSDRREHSLRKFAASIKFPYSTVQRALRQRDEKESA